MSTTSDIKNGSIVRFKNARMKIVEFQHVKPGKGPAFVRTKLKDIKSGKVIDQTFNAGVKLEFIKVTSSQFQYLYKDANSYVFMHNQTFNQVEVSELLMQDTHQYIKEGDNLDLVFDGDEIINMNLPAKVILAVAQTDPGHRGNTATNASKPAKMETGLEIQVPLFINEGDLLRIDTKSGTYSERVKQ
tara:strand:+ start:85 stop:648 length:564 start_codon:yes stop_codon:yes gene_type:complete